MIEQFDGRLGLLMEMLKSRGLDRDTVVIFMTDNGTAEGAVLDKEDFVRRGFNAGMRGKKGSVYEGGHRVPFWIRYPAGGLQGGHDLDRLSGHIDVLPTLIELCGLNAPSPKVAFDGTSLMPSPRRKPMAGSHDGRSFAAGGETRKMAADNRDPAVAAGRRKRTHDMPGPGQKQYRRQAARCRHRRCSITIRGGSMSRSGLTRFPESRSAAKRKIPSA
jgi:arylsulfatase A-like enzyme